MGVTFAPAVRRHVPLLVGLTGPAGSGKTYSALRIAAGIAGERPFFGIDTEAGRMLHYAEDFRFMHAELVSPFTPARYLEAIHAAVAAGAPAIVVDSMSHEWAGPGGVLDMHDAQLHRMAGDDWGKRERVKMAAWIEPKRHHGLFVAGLLAVRVPLVLCFRGKRTTKMERGSNGKMDVSEGPFRATTSEDLPYEMTALVVLSEDKPGTVDRSQPSKISKPIVPLMRDGATLDERFGAALATWACGETAARESGEQLRAQAPDARPRGLRSAIAELEAALQAAVSVEEYREIVGSQETRRIRDAAVEKVPDDSARLEQLLGDLGARWFGTSSGEVDT